MSGAKIRLLLASLCFLGWLGWLAFLALTTSRAIVVSRSQILFATHAARVNITVQDGEPKGFEVIDFLGRTPQDDFKPNGERVDLKDLKLVLLPFQKRLTQNGVYLVPLSRTAKDSFRMVAPPNSIESDGDKGRFLIYPDTPEVLQQIRELLPEAS
jgi:hypothetical protein